MASPARKPSARFAIGATTSRSGGNHRANATAPWRCVAGDQERGDGPDSGSGSAFPFPADSPSDGGTTGHVGAPRTGGGPAPGGGGAPGSRGGSPSPPPPGSSPAPPPPSA